MVSKRINARCLETSFLLKYCTICQICSKSVYSSIFNILQCILMCFFPVGKTRFVSYRIPTIPYLVSYTKHELRISDG